MPKGPGRRWVLDALAGFEWEASPDYAIASLTPEQLAPALARCCPTHGEAEPVTRPVRVFVIAKPRDREPERQRCGITAARLARLLTEALALQLPGHVTPTGEREVLGFVRKWGRLGVGLRGHPQCGLDEVFAVYAELRTLATWARAYDALRCSQLDAPALRDFVPPPRRHRRGFEDTLPSLFMRQLELKHAQGLFHGMFPALTYRRHQGFRAAVRIPDATLFDVLWLGLWVSLLEGLPPQACPECEQMFLPHRRGQHFCSRRCQNRANQRTYYHAKLSAKARKG